MRAKALVVGLAVAASGWVLAQPADPAAASRGEAGDGVEQAAGQDPFDPASVPLVEVIGAREDGQAIMGVVVAPGQALLSPGDQWTPGARVHCAGTGEEGPVTRVLNWGGRRSIEWAVLEVAWPDGAGVAPQAVAEEQAEVGDALRFVSWRNGEYTTFAGNASSTHCATCAHHIPFTGDDESAMKLRRGAPVLDDHGELAGLLYERGFGLSLPRFRAGWNAGYIPSSRWQVESVEPVTEERFAEILSDQASARAAMKAAVTAYERREWTEAMAAAREAIRLDPNLGRAWLTLGYAAYKLDRHGIAITALRNALRRNEEPAYATGLLAMTVAALGDRDQAVQLALRVEEAWADDAGALGNAAIALLMVHRDDDARRLLRRALELNPDDERTSRMLRSLDAAEEPERG